MSEGGGFLDFFPVGNQPAGGGFFGNLFGGGGSRAGLTAEQQQAAALEALGTVQGFGQLIETRPELFGLVPTGQVPLVFQQGPNVGLPIFPGSGITADTGFPQFDAPVFSSQFLTPSIGGLTPFEQFVTPAIAGLQGSGQGSEVEGFLNQIAQFGIEVAGNNNLLSQVFGIGVGSPLGQFFTPPAPAPVFLPIPELPIAPPGFPVMQNLPTTPGSPVDPATLPPPQGSTRSTIEQFLDSILRGFGRGNQLSQILEQWLRLFGVGGRGRAPAQPGFQFPDFNITFPGQLPVPSGLPTPGGPGVANLEGILGGILGGAAGVLQTLNRTGEGSIALPGGSPIQVPGTGGGFNLPFIDITREGAVAGAACAPRLRNPHTIMLPNPCPGKSPDTYVKAPKAIFKVSVKGPRRGCRRR